GVDGSSEAAAGPPEDALPADALPEDATPAGGAARHDPEADAGEPAPPATPPSPWVNPSPLDLVVPASAWRAAEPTDSRTAAAAAAAEASLEDDLAPDEEHFEPPEVVLPPQEDLHFWGAVIGLVAGPLMLLYVVFARPFHSTRWFVAAVLVSLVGFALLILRQPKDRDPTSGDDGARI
ncbi:MAG TPA: hypothetical protein VLQ78_10685, partial [Ornithinibacter sp.]|nr:hypothetical protein [Ornithinibacter sp.]